MSKLPSIPPSRSKDVAVEKIRELVSIWKGERGNKLDRVVTYRDLVSAKLGKLSAGGSLLPGDDPEPPPTYVGPLTNLTADGGFGFIFLGWDGYNQPGYAYTEIWRHDADNLANATLVATSRAGLYPDPVGSGEGYYYWVRAVSTSDNPGPFNATAGTYAESALHPDYIIEQIAGLVSESELAAELLTPIQAIPSIQTTLDDHGIRIPTVEGIVAQHEIDIPDLQNRLSTAEGDIVTAETDITNLQASVTSAELDIVANADATTALDSRVTTNETSISTQAGQITSLQSSLNGLTVLAFDSSFNYAIGDLFSYSNVVYQVIATQTQPNVTPPNATYYEAKPDYESLEDTVTANAAAVSSLDTRVTSAEGTITAHGADITLLQTDVTTAQGDISGNTSALSAMDTRVTTAEGTISAHSTDITSLESTVNDGVTGVAANAAGVSALDTRVTSAEGSITSNSSDITALENTVNDPVTGVAANAAAATSLDSRVTVNEGDISSQSTQLTALGNSLATAEGDITANSNALSLLDGRVTTAEGVITANSSDITQLQADVQALDVDGNAQALQELDVRVTANETDISAIASDVTTLTASVDGNTAAIQTKAEVSAVQTLEDDITVLSAEYTVKLDVNGRVSGIGLANDGDTSEFIVASDAVYFIDPGQSITPFNPNTNYSSMAAARDTQLVFGYAQVEGFKRFVINVPAYIPEAYITGLQVKLATITGANIVNASIGGAKIDIAEIWDLTINDRIRSNNYAAGSTGFIINRSGNVEFNNITARGHIEADTGYISQNLQIGGTSQDIGDLLAAADDVSLFQNWIRPGTTLIDGNKIFTGDAYVDTLQIKGEAVTIPAGARRQQPLAIGSSFTTVASFNFNNNTDDAIGGILTGFVRVTSAFGQATITVEARAVVNGTPVEIMQAPDIAPISAYVSLPKGVFSVAIQARQINGSSMSVVGSIAVIGAKR